VKVNGVLVTRTKLVRKLVKTVTIYSVPAGAVKSP